MGIEFIYNEDLTATTSDGATIFVGSRDTNFTRSVYRANGSPRASWDISLSTPINNFWMTSSVASNFENSRPLLILSEAASDFFRLTTPATGINFITAEIFDGTWNSVGTTTIGLKENTLNTNFTIRLDVRPTNGIVEIFIEGTLALSVANINTIGSVLANSVDSVTLDSTSADERCDWSEIIIANNENIVNYRVAQIDPAADGDSSDWTGTFEEVNELNVDDLDFINTESVNVVSLFSGVDVPENSLTPKTISVSSRIRTDATGPQGVNIVLKTGGLEFHSNELAIANTYDTYINVWAINPNTNAAFTVTEANAIQYGINSRT